MSIVLVFKAPPAFLDLRAAGSFLGLLVSACHPVVPDYRLPGQAAIRRSERQDPFAGEGNGVVSNQAPADWWVLYQDPRLDKLVLQAADTNTNTNTNTDLSLAAANLQRVYYRVEQSGSTGELNAGAEAGVQRSQESAEAFLLSEKGPVVNTGDFSISTSYQFDLFGISQRGIEGVKADGNAAQATADVARITPIADVVRSYLQVCAATKELEIAQEFLSLRDENTRLIQRLRDAGRGDETQVTRAQTQCKSLRANRRCYTAKRQAGLYQLSMSLSKPVDQLPAGIATCEELPRFRQLRPVGESTAILQCRPNVRQAERQLAGGAFRSGGATGEFYPAISFGFSAGATGIFERGGESRTNHWGLAPQISWSRPTNDAHARIHQAEAKTRGALAHFDAVVLNAIRETQTDLEYYTRHLQRGMRSPMQSNLYRLRLTKRTESIRRVVFLFWRTCERVPHAS